MYYFSFDKRNNIADILRCLPIHDSVYAENQYNKTEKEWKVTLYNPICNTKMYFVFQSVCLILATDFDIWGKDIWGKNDEISSLTLEDNYTFLTPILEKTCKINKNEYLYFLFQSFSGNEIHIICKTASCEIINENQTRKTGDASVIDDPK